MTEQRIDMEECKWHRLGIWHGACGAADTAGTIGIAHAPVHHGACAQMGAVPAAPCVVDEPVAQIVTAAHAAHVALDGGGAPTAAGAQVRSEKNLNTHNK